MAYIDNNEGESLKIVLEISFKNTSFFPFRLIGDKANGVFVTCLNDERSFLKNGDIFLYCENVKLSGLSCNQVYSVIKFFSLKNDGIINIIIWRNNSKNFESSYTQYSGHWICPTCKYHVRSRRLHTIKHDWISSAKKFLPHSASNFFELQRFNDKEDNKEVDDDSNEDDNVSNYGEYSSLL
uniref:Homeobox domain-containing protein n=1 Tax=Strongyloides stercoralis TaxID=6248 RepID=A0AAF5DQ34_STRER